MTTYLVDPFDTQQRPYPAPQPSPARVTTADEDRARDQAEDIAEDRATDMYVDPGEQAARERMYEAHLCRQGWVARVSSRPRQR